MTGPPLEVGAALETVVLGPPVLGVIALWDEANERSLWFTKEAGRLDDLLGRGWVARAPLPYQSFREAGFIDRERGLLVLTARWADTDGSRPTEVFEIAQIEGPERADVEWIHFERWLTGVIEAAIPRGEMVIIEPGGWEPPPEPYVLAAVSRNHDGAWISTIGASPPVIGSERWDAPGPGERGSSMIAPANDGTIRAAPLLVVDAAKRWANQPHDLGITYRPAPDGPFPALEPGEAASAPPGR